MWKFEQRWAECALSSFIDDEGAGLVPLPNEVDYLKCFQRMRAQATPLAALGLRTAVWLIALAPIWLGVAARTLSSCKSRERTKIMSRLLSDRRFVVRELAMLLKLVASAALLGEPSIRARSGYDNVTARDQSESGVRRRRLVMYDAPNAISAEAVDKGSAR
jgi:hypothetical protein